jgi:hypothetical protein
VDEAAVSHERGNPEAEIDYFCFGEVLPKLVEQLLRRLTMVAGQYFGESDRSLLAGGQDNALAVVRYLRDQLLGKSLLPCQGKPGAQSELAVILLGHLQARQLS